MKGLKEGVDQRKDGKIVVKEPESNLLLHFNGPDAYNVIKRLEKPMNDSALWHFKSICLNAILQSFKSKDSHD